MRLSQRLLFRHVRKAGGTSLRRMLAELVASPRLLYPNDGDLRRLLNGWYPGPADFVRQVRAPTLGVF